VEAQVDNVSTDPVVHSTRGPAEFDQWATTAGPDLMRFAVATIGNPHDASDAVQDAMMAVYPRWRRLAESGAADAYARRVIINHRITWWRRVGRRESLVDPPDRGASGPAPGNAGDTVLARQLLQALPRQQRAAVVLRFLDDLTFAQIADILGCPESTARSHVHRALTRLREQLGDDDD
jgi:RNA polymerase sigma-70 factor (sigma-E family)